MLGKIFLSKTDTHQGCLGCVKHLQTQIVYYDKERLSLLSCRDKEPQLSESWEEDLSE